MKLLEMKDIHKSFSGVHILKGVNLNIGKSEVHALLGENGAGKSTLMNVLTGVHTKDSGTVVFDGKPIENATIKMTEDLGIAFVHQELNLFNDLTVYENVFLTKEYTNKFGMCKKKEMVAKARELFEGLGVDIDAEERVSELKTSQKQLLEISKALFSGAKLLILDEPTTSLNNDEVTHLFGIIRRLKKEGTSFVFISHKMPEIFEISDRYTVFRNGEYIAEGNISETNPEEITKLMVGASFSNTDIYEPRKNGGCVLEARQLSGEGFHHIDLDIKKGQVVGFTGLQGSGSSELMQCIFGLTHPTHGTLKVNGQMLKKHNVHESMKAGVAMLAANRKENSVIADMNLVENMYLAEHTLSAGNFHINLNRELKKFADYKKMLSIKCEGANDAITSLSGGNQQKVFIARWLNTGADILLFDNPTQGIDVGAKSEIYKLILQLADQGKTILVNTLEIPEIQKIADYCLVFYDGKIVKQLAHNEITEETVMLYSVGGGETS